MKLLFLEDCQEIADFIVPRLKEIGFEVTHALDGVEGMRELRDGDFNLIVCDHRMPRALGHEVYIYLREELKRDTFFIHHSSMPCPKYYPGCREDKKFKVVAKEGIFDKTYEFVENLFKEGFI